MQQCCKKYITSQKIRHMIGLDISGILLIFLFGLRHGMAADHIAVIDGLGLHLYNRGKPRIIPWLGTLFAAGHGIIITVYIVFAKLGIQSLHLTAFKWLNWVPVVLLFTIAFLNLRALKKKPLKQGTPGFERTFSGRSKGSLPAILIGVCMVMVFDTLADAAAWGYSAASTRSIWGALIAGGVFTAGMVITDTIDSRLLAKIVKVAPTDRTILQQRRFLNWVIVIFSFAIGLQKLFSEFNASFQLSEDIDLAIGLLLVLTVAVSYIKIYRVITANRSTQ